MRVGCRPGARAQVASRRNSSGRRRAGSVGRSGNVGVGCTGWAVDARRCRGVCRWGGRGRVCVHAARKEKGGQLPSRPRDRAIGAVLGRRFGHRLGSGRRVVKLGRERWSCRAYVHSPGAGFDRALAEHFLDILGQHLKAGEPDRSSLSCGGVGFMPGRSRKSARTSNTPIRRL
jgi:hypothetical protein